MRYIKSCFGERFLYSGAGTVKLSLSDGTDFIINNFDDCKSLYETTFGVGFYKQMYFGVVLSDIIVEMSKMVSEPVEVTDNGSDYIIGSRNSYYIGNGIAVFNDDFIAYTMISYISFLVNLIKSGTNMCDDSIFYVDRNSIWEVKILSREFYVLAAKLSIMEGI